ncbi:MFS transporter [Lactiplantibacillus sp. WILCCON 0030]|uniref:MFS transporter n=1 Tax=Lactiplantibacillus brownii TaxID=3069269 RepID=A0ABU1A870_9LACO|nr:MFS transporter [Lactiplantibacillus brownii]MDQ7936652.1 MFS transporter [Lactiplantibacillus brownii]
MKLSLAEHQLIRSGASTIINALGAQLFSYTLGYYLLAQTGSALSFGLSIFIGPIVSLVTAPWIANLIDSWSHKKTTILGTILTIISLLGFEGYVILTNGKYGLLASAVIVSIFMNIAGRFFSLSYMASVKGIVPSKLVQRLNAVQSVGNSTAGILAPPLAGVLFGLFPLKYILLIQIITELVTLWLTHRTDFNAFSVENKVNSVISDEKVTFRSVWEYLLREHRLLFLVILASLLNVAYVAFQIGGPYVVMHQLHKSATISGTIQSFTSVGVVLGGMIITFVMLKNIFRFAFWVYTLFGLVMVFTGVLIQTAIFPLLVIFSCVNFCLGLLNALGDPPLFAYFQTEAPYNLLGHLTTVMLTLSQILNPIGVLVYTFLFDHVRYQVIYSGTAIILLMLGVTLFLWLHAIDSNKMSD